MRGFVILVIRLRFALDVGYERSCVSLVMLAVAG